MSETGQVERAARRAIARAKARRDDAVTSDDLLVGALAQVSRFDVAWIGDWPIDLRELEDDAAGENGDDPADGAVAAPAYSLAAVHVFERAAALAQEDGSSTTALVHLLAAFSPEDCGLMETLQKRHGFTEADWRAVLARGGVGAPARLAGMRKNGAGQDTPGGVAAPGGSQILSVDETAEYLGVHAQTVRNYIRGGKLPAYRLAGERNIRVLREDLLSLLERVQTDDTDESEEPT